MDLLPAVDIRGGRCVRLLRGDFADETAYGDPVEVALAHVAAGASWVHVVDLDAARSGEPVNRAQVLEIAARVDAKVQVGGGVRGEADVTELLGGGVERVVLGTAAIEEPELVPGLAARHPGRIVVGLDHKRTDGGGREVVVRGWEARSGLGLGAALDRFAGLALAAVVITDVTTDGTLAGPDLAGLGEALAATGLPLIASGGVGTLEHLLELRDLGAGAGGRGLAGVIVGRAILSGAIDLREALRACT